MDSKKEKYYDYIVRDMVKNTPIDFDDWTIDIPTYGKVLIQVVYQVYNNDWEADEDIIDFVESKYGVTDIEADIIWGRYIKTLKDIIDTNG